MTQSVRPSSRTARAVLAVAAIAFAALGALAGPSRAPASQTAARASTAARTAVAPIDRRALVARHNPVLRAFDAESPLSVGNGRFAFTADVTGLQTFPEAFEQTIPLGTLSDWGWHSSPNPQAWSIDRYQFTEFESHGRKVGYADIPGDQRTPEIQWLRANPHRLHLGRLGFELVTRDGRKALWADLSAIEQVLDLWSGELTSRFEFDGERVEVHTICHPGIDALSVRVASPLMRRGRLRIVLAFPYGTGQMTAADWSRPGAHVTEVRPGSNAASFTRRLDGDTYAVALSWAQAGAMTRTNPHSFAVTPAKDASTFELSVLFSAAPQPGSPPTFAEVQRTAGDHWRGFWQTGGAIDLSGSRDPRWQELERRIVLSQYLTAIQCAGRTPPQETGLTFNSWEGKFHLEMHWWHAAQFALWDRFPLLENSLDYYRRILPRAKAAAARQGYTGARWPKMTDPAGAESPSTVGPFLVWQQPHPIFYAELAYRANPARATLDRFSEVVFETATFMASYPARDAATDRLVLGPPLQCAQEVFPKETTTNCTFELAYWRWGLETAQAWRERLGLPREAAWDRVLASLSPLPVADGRYLFAGSAPDSYTNPRWARDHPAVTAACGVLPCPGVDRDAMRRTLDWIWRNWSWPDTWGWDYPMVAMAAARLGAPELAVNALLLATPKNMYRLNGHNHQRPGLTIYLPGNGGLLYAVAMMAAGWDGAPDRPAPGFPADGSWVVRWEGLRRAP